MKKIFDCPHGMGKASSCVECMEDGPIGIPDVDDRLTAAYFTVAKYRGECRKCDGDIFEGDSIGSTDLGWLCVRCCRP